MSEAAILKRVMLEASKLGLRVFRNQNGKYELKDGRWISSGLVVGASDLIGFQIGTGFFVAIEVKRPGGRISPEQLNFLAQVNKAGGIGIICDDEKNLKNLLDESLENRVV